MVKKRMYQNTHKFKKQGFNMSQIALKLGITRKTVKKYLNMDIKKFQKYKLKLLNRSKNFEPYKEDIIELYRINQPKKLYTSSIYDYLEEKYGKLDSCEKTLRNYVNFLIQMNEISIGNTARVYKKVPELPFGQQMQLDFGEYTQTNKRKLYIFAALLSASRYKFVRFQETPFKTVDVIRLLLECFDAFGGIPEELVIDQDKLMVVRENYGDIIYTKDFTNFIEEMDLRMYVCRKADPESKGKIENLVKFTKVNFLNTRTFEGAEGANTSVFEWLLRRANGKISQATKKIPLIEIEEERAHLKKIKNSLFRKDSGLGREDRNVTDNYISVNSNYYGLPGKYNDKHVDIYTTNKKLFIFDRITEIEIACYDLSLFTGKKIMHRAFKRATEIKLNELKDTVKSYFDHNDLWLEFLENSFKAFSRYNRDQCIEVKKYFKDKDIEIAILEAAIKYCIKNKTFSIANLHDTYKHYLYCHNEAVAEIGQEKSDDWYNEFLESNLQIDVRTRSVQEYANAAYIGGKK